jgi:hypothetical protein
MGARERKAYYGGENRTLLCDGRFKKVTEWGLKGKVRFGMESMRDDEGIRDMVKLWGRARGS